MKGKGVFAFALAMGLIFTGAAAAHDGSYTLSFDDFTVQNLDHYDQDPFKGWMNLSVTNTGNEAWGDFHFEIIGNGIENVHFIVDDPYAPSTVPALSSLNWVVDNDVVGATLDMYFYGDPVGPGESIQLNVYTDNTIDQNSFFGMAVWPTPVPEPATLTIMAIAGLALIRRK